MTVMGEALVDGLSDAGSTPARSTAYTESELAEFGFCAFRITLHILVCAAVCRSRQESAEPNPVLSLILFREW